MNRKKKKRYNQIYYICQTVVRWELFPLPMWTHSMNSMKPVLINTRIGWFQGILIWLIATENKKYLLSWRSTCLKSKACLPTWPQLYNFRLQIQNNEGNKEKINKEKRLINFRAIESQKCLKNPKQTAPGHYSYKCLNISPANGCWMYSTIIFLESKKCCEVSLGIEIVPPKQKGEGKPVLKYRAHDTTGKRIETWSITALRQWLCSWIERRETVTLNALFM